MNIRNIAIIAHVDHGKTTLVDHLLRQSGTFRDNEVVEERLMDSMDLERERGITIAAKNCAVLYDGVKINIVDTPGHSDFGGEVERVLNMVDGCVLLVDASEGPLPQTRFVLKKALEQGKKVIVCINKIDRPDARIQEVLDEIFGLFIDLDADDQQADFKVVYAVAREGYAVMDPTQKGDSLEPLFKLILSEIPAPKGQDEDVLQMMVANLSYNDYVGRLAIGRVQSGVLRQGEEVMILGAEGKQTKIKVTALYNYQGVKQQAVKEVRAGDVAIVAGMEAISIGDSLTSLLDPRPLPRLAVDEPTVGMMFSVNDSPFAGREGKQVTSRKIIERLDRELLHNVAIRVEKTASPDTWKVIGRGELQLGVLIEQMRREGFELLVSKPQVIFRTENGQKMEPMELAVIDVEESHVGVVTEKLGTRKGIMTNMQNKGSGRVRLEFQIPARGLIGYRSEFLTDTRGTGLLNTQYMGYSEFRGEFHQRMNGALISDRVGKTTAYALYNLEPRGRMFVGAAVEVYEGMVVGEHSKENDLIVNACREKKLTNVRASGSDEAIRLTPIKPMSLEFAMEWITDEELIEVTPQNIRIRCRELEPNKRKSKASKEE